jgi:hypothetical protein
MMENIENQLSIDPELKHKRQSSMPLVNSEEEAQLRSQIPTVAAAALATNSGNYRP